MSKLLEDLEVSCPLKVLKDLQTGVATQEMSETHSAQVSEAPIPSREAGSECGCLEKNVGKNSRIGMKLMMSHGL